ncbi:MAG: hypothetical protein AAF434_14395 [Pseudomonadota bacterium]
MKYKSKKPDYSDPDEPLPQPDHERPVTRRDFLAQGFIGGVGTVLGTTALSMFANPRAAYSALSPDLELLKTSCGIATQGAGKIPFICIDLAGGASMGGSNVLVGRQGGQMDFLTTAGYSRLGLPGDMIPGVAEPGGAGSSATGTSNGDHTDTTLGLGFHADSAFLRGMLEKISISHRALINGAVIPARSENDTGNNPHNPMYGINKLGADGSLLTLIGSENSVSGGNSMAPDALIDPSAQPTKVDQPSDVTGLVDTGKLIGVLDQSDAVSVLESIQRVSSMKLDAVAAEFSDTDIQDQMNCGYVKSADLADRFGDPSTLNPEGDPLINGTDAVFNTPIFTADDFNDREFRKTASVMKLVINGFAGAGTISMGGYDYHGGARARGEVRDLRAGRCMGACLEYAARVNVPLMLYVSSDGSLSSDGTIDNTEDGRGKGEWVSDNSSTAASFFLVYNPAGRPTLLGGTLDQQAMHQQLGYFRPDGSVETTSSPAANNVNLLVNTVLLNYAALHGDQAAFTSLFPGNSHGLGSTAAALDSMTAFNPIVTGTI